MRCVDAFAIAVLGPPPPGDLTAIPWGRGLDVPWAAPALGFAMGSPGTGIRHGQPRHWDSPFAVPVLGFASGGPGTHAPIHPYSGRKLGASEQDGGRPPSVASGRLWDDGADRGAWTAAGRVGQGPASAVALGPGDGLIASTGTAYRSALGLRAPHHHR